MNYITVSGRALVKRTTVLYRAKIVLNADQLYFDNSGYESLEEFTEEYFKKLREKNIDPSKFKEEKIEYLGYGYQTAGTVFNYETDSKEQLLALSKVKMPEITIQYKCKSVIKPEELLLLKEKSLADAKENALRICKVADKKLGDIIAISDNVLAQTVWNDLYNYEEYASIEVSYEMN